MINRADALSIGSVSLYIFDLVIHSALALIIVI